MLGSVEIKTNQMRKAKAMRSELAVARESATITCLSADTPDRGWDASEWGKSEDFTCALIGGCWSGEAVGSQTRSGVSYMTA